uniref:Uncharacterized protein n=1 Tax=Anguilla anguilla TaxID=7936 RepID=A0A0E9RHU2_ANGAN
MQGCTVPTAG